MTQLQRIQPATGLDTESALEYVPATAAPVLRNLLAHKAGKLVQRGGLSKSAVYWPDGVGVGIIGPVIGPIIFRDTVIWTALNPDGSGDLLLHQATLNSNGTITYGSTKTLPSPDWVLDGPHARAIDYVWLLATAPTAGSYVTKWDGTTFTPYTTGPQAATDVAFYADRLWVLGGSVPGTTSPVFPNRLYYPDPGDPADTADAWKDDVSGLVNQLKLPDDGVALATLPSALAIFCKDSVHMLTGSGSATFTRKKVLARGLTNTDAVCAYGDGAYFLSRDGLFYFDGAQERLVSTPVETKLAQQDGVVMTGRVADFGNGYLWVKVYDDGDFRWSGLYHTATGNWTEFTVNTSLMASGTPESVAAADGHVVLLDKHRIWNAADVTARNPSTQLGYDTNGTHYAIDSSWMSRAFRLGTPTNKAHVKRVMIDYGWASGTAGNAWTYSIYTAPPDQPGSDGKLLKSGTLHADGNPEIHRRRASIEVRSEAEDLWVVIGCNAVPAGDSRAELYDIWVEYDVAQQSSGY